MVESAIHCCRLPRAAWVWAHISGDFMTDNAVQPPQATATVVKRGIPVLVWILVLLFAVAAFGAAIVYSGGVDSALQLVGLGSPAGDDSGSAVTPQGNKPAGAPASGATSTTAGETTATAGSDSTKTAGGSAAPAATSGSSTKKKVIRDPGLPTYARLAMYRGQLRSQRPITKLVANQVSSIRLGTPRKSATKATVPLTLSYRDGSTVSGTMTLNKYGSRWYFAGLSTSGDKVTPNPNNISSAVVATIVRQQSTRANQSNITNGILGGGFKTVTVTSVSGGSGTATVNVRLSGGTAAAKNGQFVCISQSDGPTKYWFIARFVAK